MAIAHGGGTGDESLRANWKCLVACGLVSMASFQYGIDFGLIAGLQAMPGFLKIYGYREPKSPSGWNISTERQQLISSLMTLGAIIGAGASGPLARLMGRKACLWSACVLCAAADAIMMGTTSIGGMYAGRLIIGLANGLFMTFSQLYLQECSPPKLRGLALATFSFWTAIGQLVGTIVDNYTAPIDSRASYLIPLGLIYIVPLLLGVGLFFIPESPRYLMEQGELEQAAEALYWLRPNSDAVEPELVSIKVAIEEEEKNKGREIWRDMWRDRVNRRRTSLAVLVVLTQAASGAMYMLAYGTYFFEMAGVGKPFQNSVILTAVGVLAMLINMMIITRYGRRRVFLTWGLVLCGVLQLIIAAIFDAKPRNQSVLQAVVGLSVVYIYSFNGLISPYAFLSGGEIPSQRMRSYTFGLATAVSFLGGWLVTFTTPYFINPNSLNWGPRYGYIWAPSCFISAIWVLLYLPELKGRSLEEVDEMFAVGLPARKFRSYVCRGPAVIAATTDVYDDASDVGGPEERITIQPKGVQDKTRRASSRISLTAPRV